MSARGTDFRGGEVVARGGFVLAVGGSRSGSCVFLAALVGEVAWQVLDKCAVLYIQAYHTIPHPTAPPGLFRNGSARVRDTYAALWGLERAVLCCVVRCDAMQRGVPPCQRVGAESY
jgi:hypothetical protein